ncbi:MAG: MFS transporter [Terracidiphilus sp.]|jgi:ACS family hexuronate transporter-like MFS transporter
MATKADLATQDKDLSSLGARIGHVRWTICAMLFAATSINYMDRSVLAILKPTLMKPISEHGIGMTEVGYGHITALFMVAYAIGLLVAGRFIDKVGTRIGYMVIMAVWSLSAMGHALANSVLEFGIMRFTLGLGESGNFPAAIKTTAEWFPQGERSLATGIFNSGTNLGAILAPIIVPWVTIYYGWHAAFLVTGLFSATWIILWYRKYRKPSNHPTLTGAELRHIYQEAAEEMGPFVPWRKLLGHRQTWAFTAGKFITDPIWWFFLFYLPSYFSAKFHLDIAHLGLPLIIVYSSSTAGSIAGGWLPAPFRRFGLTTTRARLAAMLTCACLIVPVFLVNYLSSEWVAIGLLSLATAAHQGWSANLFTTSSDMFPRSAVGSVVGIGGMAGAASGALFMNGTGYILQFTHSYASLFAIAASAYLTAFLVIVLLAPGLKKVELAA